MTFHKGVSRVNGIAVEVFLQRQEQHPVPLLFVHGSSCGSWLWDNFLQFFSSRGWLCYALNLRGHHLSVPVDDWGEVGVSSYLEDIDKVVKWIGKDLIVHRPQHGRGVGQKYAEANNPLKLILLHTSPPLSVIKQIDFNAFMKRGREQGRLMKDKVVESDSDPQKLIGYMFDPGNVEPAVLEQCHKAMGKESARALQEMQQVEVDAHKINCPVYVLGFNLKKIGLDYPVDLSRELARYYRARDFQIIEPGGHLFMLEKNWEEFVRLIEKWVRKSSLHQKKRICEREKEMAHQPRVAYDITVIHDCIVRDTDAYRQFNAKAKKLSLYRERQQRLDKHPEIKKIIDVTFVRSLDKKRGTYVAKVGWLPTELVMTDQRIREMCRNMFTLPKQYTEKTGISFGPCPGQGKLSAMSALFVHRAGDPRKT